MTMTATKTVTVWMMAVNQRMIQMMKKWRLWVFKGHVAGIKAFGTVDSLAIVQFLPQ